jgi:hypothetical protein
MTPEPMTSSDKKGCPDELRQSRGRGSISSPSDAVEFFLEGEMFD